MPEVTVHLPTPLRPYAEGRSDIALEANSVGALLDALQDDYPSLVQCIRTRDGALRPYVNVFVRRTDVRQLDGLATALQDGDEVVVMPSVAGGSCPVRRSPPPATVIPGRLHLPPAAIRRVRAASEAAWPHEACGLLEGTADGPMVRVARLVSTLNVDDDPTRRYTIDPEAFLHADRAAQQRGCSIVGTWHSHPHGDPAPSATDLAEAWPDWSYLIAGVTNGTSTALRCWRLHDGEFSEQPIAAAGDGEPFSEVSDERT